MDINTFCQEIIKNKEELIILSLNLPEIHKAFENNSVILSPSGQLIATTTKRVNEIKGKDSWITLLSRFWSEDQIEKELSADQVDYPVEYFPSYPFSGFYHFLDEDGKKDKDEATKQAAFIFETLTKSGIELPEKYS